VPHADLFMLRSLPRNSSVTHPVVAVLVEAEKIQIRLFRCAGL